MPERRRPSSRIWTVETLRSRPAIEAVLKTESLEILTGRSNPELARKIGDRLGLMVDEPVTLFADGEINAEASHNLRRKNVYVVQPTSRIIDEEGHIIGSVNDSLQEVCHMVNVAKLSSADEVNAVIPYFGYGRGDQKNKSRVTIAAALAAKEIQLAGANRILTMDLHAEQTVGMVDIPWDNIYARPVILEEVEKMGLEDLVFVAADAGGVKRAVAFQNLTVGNSNIAVAYKIRPRANEVEVLRVVGDLEGKDAFIAEDVIDTAGTIVDVAKAVKACGAKRIFVAAAHGIFSTDKYGVPALQKIDESPIDQIIITDSIKQPPAVVNHPRIKIVSIVDMFAEAMLRIHTGESVGQLIPSINGKKH